MIIIVIIKEIFRIKPGLAENYNKNLKEKLRNLTKSWVNRKISNFDYLMYLNTIAGKLNLSPFPYPLSPPTLPSTNPLPI